MCPRPVIFLKSLSGLIPFFTSKKRGPIPPDVEVGETKEKVLPFRSFKLLMPLSLRVMMTDL